MTTASELTARWAARLEEWRRLGVHVDGAAVASEILADLDALAAMQAAESLTLKEASLIGGYSVDHLQRLLASGQIENVGRKHRPRIRRVDVPVKPGHHLPNGADDVFSARRRIVASVVTLDRED